MSYSVAERVLARETLEFASTIIHVKKASKPEEKLRSNREHFCIVEVYGIEGHDNNFIKTIFENKKTSGGGPIKDIAQNPDGKFTIVHFEKREGKYITALRNLPLELHLSKSIFYVRTTF